LVELKVAIIICQGKQQEIRKVKKGQKQAVAQKSEGSNALQAIYRRFGDFFLRVF
jgi:hypothetical protein